MKNTTLVFLIMILIPALYPVSAKAQNQFNVMVYTSPDRWHNRTIPTAIIEFEKMAKRHSFGLTWTQQPENFSDDFLGKFEVVVFLQANGGELSGEQMESFKRFIRNGGGFVGIHGASIAADQEEWYQKLVGRVFTDHPEVQTAVMDIIDRGHPSTIHLPARWLWTDEWYSFGEPLTDNQKVLITVDESTYGPDKTWGDNTRFSAMGDFHPVAWYQEFDGGRSFYTSLGHMPSLFEDRWFLEHIYGGIFWAATGVNGSE